MWNDAPPLPLLAVLATLQLYLGLLVPSLLVVRSQCVTYEAWKQRRAAQAEEQSGVAAAACPSAPADWQYEGVSRVLRSLTTAQLALLLAAVLLEFYFLGVSHGGNALTSHLLG
jgi:hypothetical protein